ncbi:MAG: DsbE family thiol:disulfide interchange protein [Gammaproteobacteria bacterium]|nr:DsbE family thiol:disulfide interchange protein [Gammaproteobacteria bacterium]
MKKFIFYAPIAAFLALAFVLWRGLYLDPTELPSVLIDKPMPSFVMTTVGGEPVSNADLPGRVFLLNVWGSYCLPCLVEHPTLMRLSEEGEFPVVGVNYRDRRLLALDWLDVNGDPFEYSILDEDGRFGIALGVYGAPETFLVDGEGVIRYRHVGVLEENVWREVFMPAIAELRGALAPSR